MSIIAIGKKNQSLMKKIIAKENGSFTIEAAVIMPITLLLILSIFFVSFYEHDIVTITAVSDYAALERAAAFSSNKIDSAADVNNILNSRLINTAGASVSIENDDMQVSASAAGQFSVPLPFISEITNDSMGDISTVINLTNLNGRKKLLIYKSICDGVSYLAQGGKSNNGD